MHRGVILLTTSEIEIMLSSLPSDLYESLRGKLSAALAKFQEGFQLDENGDVITACRVELNEEELELILDNITDSALITKLSQVLMEIRRD